MDQEIALPRSQILALELSLRTGMQLMRIETMKQRGRCYYFRNQKTRGNRYVMSATLLPRMIVCIAILYGFPSPRKGSKNIQRTRSRYRSAQ